MEEPPWTIEFYATARGTVPAEEFVTSLPAAEQAVVLRYIDLLLRFGVALREPTVKHIEGVLWELRPGPHRLFYFVYTGRRIIILHGYRKKGMKAPRREIDRARRYMRDWLKRER
jgi:phage-related protein